VKRFEVALLGLFLACWVVIALSIVGAVPLAGSLPLSLYSLYACAGSLGFLSGHVYARRRQGHPPPIRRRLFLIFFLGPTGLVYFLRALAPTADQVDAPFVPLYAFGVYAVFFFVPVLLLAPVGAGKR
jgi:hypothetical protein